MWSTVCLRLLLVLAIASVGAAVDVMAEDASQFYTRSQKLEAAGNYDAAMIEAQKFEAAIRLRLGTEGTSYGLALAAMASILQNQGRYADAEALSKRALVIFEKATGPENTNVARALDDLAEIFGSQSRYSEAEPLHKRALAIYEKTLGPNHPLVALSLSNLSWLYYQQGRYAEAEPLNKRALAIFESALGPNHQNVAASLSSLATLYNAQGRYGDAEPLFKRVLAIAEITVGADNPAFATALNNLAQLYDEERRYGEAEALKKRALAIYQKALGPEHIDVAQAINNLAALYDEEGRYGDAEPLYKRSLAIQEKVLGPDHPDLIIALNNLAKSYAAQGRNAEAEPLFKRQLEIGENALGPDHPDVAAALNDLASFYLGQSRYSDALIYARRATSAVLAHANAEREVKQKSGGASGLVAQRSSFFDNHVAALAGTLQAGLGSDADLGREAFEIGQRSVQSSTATAVQQMAARTATGKGPLADLVRQTQDLTAQWHSLDQKLIEEVSRPSAQQDKSSTEAVRNEIAQNESRFAAASAQLEKDFPDYALLTNAQPLKVKEAQNLLAADEALVFWVVGSQKSWVFALTHDDFEWHTINLGRSELTGKIANFRRGLSVEELQKALSESNVSLIFDLKKAYELYETLFGSVDALIKDKHQIVVAPSGPLTGLPMHLLVTENPPIAVPEVTNLRAYREAAWLLKRHAISVLPSVASLKALGVTERRDLSSQPFVGFGNPVFQRQSIPPPAGSRGLAAATRSYSDYWSGTEINRDALANGLAALPATADELKAVAADVGAPAADVYLAKTASEETVKTLPLSHFRIIYFATHALVAGDIKGLGEPALALTLPDKPTPLDDGLLTASEVAELKLNADWVVLSACNTAAGERPGAEALSGLARSFFYAGARALLVSHWDVNSDAAAHLMTKTFDIIKLDPHVSRSEALRRAMISYMNDTSDPWSAHPAFWGPFSLIGEGSVR